MKKCVHLVMKDDTIVRIFSDEDSDLNFIGSVDGSILDYRIEQWRVF